MPDLRLCVKNDTTGNVINVNATFQTTFTRHFSAAMCIEYCRGAADFQVMTIRENDCSVR